MVLRTLCGEGDADFVACVSQSLNPQQLFMVGLRDLDAAEQQFIQEHSIYHTPGIDLSALVQAIQQKGYSRVYVHFDVDGLNPEIFPCMSYPTDGGLTVEQISEMITTLDQNFEIVGMSLTEYASETGEGVELLDPILIQAAAIVKA